MSCICEGSCLNNIKKFEKKLIDQILFCKEYFKIESMPATLINKKKLEITVQFKLKPP
jgi:hypothetical protein